MVRRGLPQSTVMARALRRALQEALGFVKKDGSLQANPSDLRSAGCRMR